MLSSSRSPEMTAKAFVLGAGVSGLVTAWLLLERGWTVEILEREPFYGGMSRTWRWGDFLLDVGPHIYHTPDAQLAQFWEREFGDLFNKGEFFCKNVKGPNFDEYYDYPLSYEAFSRFPEDVRQRILRELQEVRSEDRATATSYRQYIRALVGPTLQEMFFEKYPQKIWGIATDEMTPLWAPKRIELREKITPFYHGQWNAVGKYGTGCVLDRIYQKILAFGGTVRLSDPVAGFDVSGQMIAGLRLHSGKRLAVEPRDVVVSTIPVSVLGRFLGLNCSLQFRGITSIYLAFRKEYVLPEGVHWLYYDSPELLFSRISEQKKFSEQCAAPGKTCITAEIAYSRGDAIDGRADEALQEVVLEQVCRTGLVRREEHIGSTINRQPFVYPLLRKDYQHELARVESELGRYGQLYSIGTTGEFSYADNQILFLKALDLVDVLTNRYSERSQTKRKSYSAPLNRQVNVRGRVIGGGARPYVVAEAGLNHNGSLDVAKQLVRRAAAIGCDAIKFQTYRSEERVSEAIKTVRYAETVNGTEETLLETFRRLELDAAAHHALFRHARKHGIEIFSTPFDVTSVDILEGLDVGLYKIASFDLVNLPLLRHVAATKKPIILSTGMSTLGQVEEALEVIRSEGNSNVILLHCVSAYPAAPEQMNLRVMETMRQAFGVPVGLSDHTLGITVSQIALALGADAVERHFTLDRTLEGPDHVLSSEPDEMAELVRYASLIEKVRGDGIKRIEASEYDALNSHRKSLYARVDIDAGEHLTADKLVIKGPAGGLQPRYLDVVVGRQLRRALRADHPVTWDDV